MAENQSRQSKNAPAPKTRSPVERIVVWGEPLVLGLAAGNEFLSKKGHEAALEKLQVKMAAVDEDPTHPEVTEVDVKEIFGGRKPSKVEDYPPGKIGLHGSKRLEVYSWLTLNPMNKRDIYVYLSSKGKDSKDLATVLGFSSKSPEDDSDSPAKGSAPTAGAPAGTPAGGAAGNMGGYPGGAGGQRGGPAVDKPADAADADKSKTTDADNKPADDDASKDKSEGKTE